ncbi:MAG: restriction endonuclease, partial [Candidatus Omnitrophota bacterium]
TKGPDFIGRFNGKYVVGEAKFLTDFGGHQNAQFADAINLLRHTSVNAVKVAILDGVLYIKGRSKMHKFLQEHPEQFNILSSLVLREFLYQV